MPPATRQLSTAEARRAEVLDAAVRAFAEHGYHATSTMTVAKAAGLSQAYLFRLFGSKADLFVAACEVTRGRMLQAFRRAAAEARAAGADPLETMGQAYAELLATDPDVLRIQLHSQAAAATTPAIQEAMRETWRQLHAHVSSVSAAPPDELRAWFAQGMLMNVMAAVDAYGVDEPWAVALTKDADGNDC